MANYQRRGLDLAQLQLVERILNPRTPTDLALSLQFPNSPASKMVEEDIQQHILLHIIIEKLVERFIQQQAQATQNEKAELMRALMEKDAAQQKFIKESAAHLTATATTKPELDQPKLLVEKLPIEIAALTQEATKITHEITKLNEQISTASSELQTRQQAQQQELIQSIKAEKIPVYAVNGEVMTPAQVEERLSSVRPPPPFLDKLKQPSISKLLTELVEQGHDPAPVAAAKDQLSQELLNGAALANNGDDNLKPSFFKKNKAFNEKQGELAKTALPKDIENISTMLTAHVKAQHAEKNLTEINQQLTEKQALLQTATKQLEHSYESPRPKPPGFNSN